ncbi:uncharacterized protein Dana_GF11946, isoform A [Drosophila ananassae]|uniref:Uncharacterized protein, isoform A n=1 Tax=Drosophila ananassae TaxID=7217 RepID=B3MDR7_DROAN|nr:uncharacterized protein LOC6494805 isoform X1 [Drosophila ananassae]EDV36452.1 uncharacterized protein Dana_GF11946, isoform A [Drosophila ananassae]
MLGDDDLDIYEDLEDFQKAEDKKSEQLLAWEEKHKSATVEIEALKAENKALGKKIKVMEVNLQNLLDTAKAEMKRKEALIDQLRKEKDDICFRRKRAPIDEDLAAREHHNKRPKLAQTKEVSRKETEEPKNPFRARSKEDNKTEKPKSRSSSPRHSLHKINNDKPRSHARHFENHQRSRDRRRSRSPRHESSRHRGKSGRESRRRSRSQSPGPKIQRPKSQTITTLFGDEPICSDNESPHSEVAKKMLANKDPSTPVELYTPDSAVKPQSTKQAIPNESEDTAAVDGYFKKNTGVEAKPTETDTTKLCEGFFSSVSKLMNLPIPPLSLFPDKNPMDPIHKVIELQNDVPEPAKQVENVCVVTASEQKDSSIQDEIPPELDSTANAHNDENPEPGKECEINSSNNAEQKEIINETACESIIQDSKLSDMLVAQELTVNETIDETVPMELEYDIYDDLDKSNAPCFSKSIGSTIIEAPKVKDGSESPKRTDENDEGIQIIENIRLPEIADIENIAFTVDKNLQDPERIKTDKFEKLNEDIQEHERKESSYSRDEASTRSSILYAQPDSTKIDHNDDAILENAMNELTGEVVPPGNHNTNYLNLSLEEDAIEMALEQLHQSSPDETVVTSTSTKARQTSKDLIAILAQSPLHTTPLKAKSPLKTPETETPVKTPLKKRRVNLLESAEKSPSQDAPVEETSGSLSCTDDSSNVTKRFSMGHTDYQFEQIENEIVLRVKRRSRRPPRAPIEPKTIPSDGKSV